MIQLGNYNTHKQAVVTTNNQILNVNSLSPHPSSGYYYKINLAKNVYNLYVEAKLIEGDKAFIYCENQQKYLIPRIYIFTKDTKKTYKIKFEGYGQVRIGILFWNAKVNYHLEVYKLELFDLINSKEQILLNQVNKETSIFTNTNVKNEIKQLEQNLLPIPTHKANLIAYISNLENLDVSLTMLVQKYLINSLKNMKCDILDIHDITDLSLYNCVILDHLSIHRGIHKFTDEEFDNILLALKTSKCTIYLGHDEHEWSFNFLPKAKHLHDKIKDIELYPRKIYEVGYFLQNFFDEYNIKGYISMSDTYEFKQIRKAIPYIEYYLLPHHINTDIFQEIKAPKNIDVLVYGWTTKNAYYFRWRMVNILKSMNIKLHIVPRKCKYDKNICERGLAKLISTSWLTLGCTDNFNYLERKFLEIASSGSVILGNMNDQGRAIFKDNYIHVDYNMSDIEIKNIITTSLANKTLLNKYKINLLKIAKLYSYNTYVNLICDIAECRYSVYQYPKPKGDIYYSSNYEPDIYITGKHIDLVNLQGIKSRKYVICPNYVIDGKCIYCDKPLHEKIEHIEKKNIDFEYNYWEKLCYNKKLLVIGELPELVIERLKEHFESVDIIN